MYGRPWTDEDTAMLLALYGEGLTSTQMGERMNRSRHVIKERIVRLGLAAPANSKWPEEDSERLRDLVSSGATITEIAAVFPDKSRRAIFHRILRMGLRPKEAPRGWTAEEIEKLTELSKSGLSGRQIAAQFNRSRKAIHNKLKALGLNLTEQRKTAAPKVAKPVAVAPAEKPRHVPLKGRLFANHPPAMSKDAMREMLAEAIRNTAAMQRGDAA